MSNASTIIIDDGLKTYEIKNRKGKVLGTFSFNPSDVNIVYRYNEVLKDLEKLDICFENVDEQTGRTEEEVIAENLKKLDSVVYEKINYLLGEDVAESFFSIMGPFSPLSSGKYFIESVMEAIAQAIRKETGVRVKKMNSKIQRHTQKYAKKYHG